MNRREFLKHSTKLIAGLGAASIVPLSWLRPSSAPAATTIGARQKGVIWDALLNSSKPDLDALYGMPRLPQYQRSQYTTGWTDPTTLPEDPNWYAGMATYIAANGGTPSGWMFFDHEDPTFGAVLPQGAGGQATRLATSQRYADLYTGLKAQLPGVRMMNYGLPPLRDLFRALTYPGHANYLQWQTDNDDFATMIAQLDALSPSVYFFYERNESNIKNGVDAEVDTAADTLTVASNTNVWNTGASALFSLTSGTITGLVSGTTYWVIRVNSTTVKLASSLVNALGGTAIDFTAKSNPVWSLTTYGPVSVMPYISRAREYVGAQVAEARRLSRNDGRNIPVYPFTWTRQATAPVPNVPLDFDVYETIIRTAYQEADGIIVWGGFYALDGTFAQQTWASDTGAGIVGAWWNQTLYPMLVSKRRWTQR